MASFPNITPQVGSRPKFKPRVREAKFGDGYSQRSSDGINSLNEEWQVAWPQLDSDRYQSIVSFLESQGGVLSFLWTPPLPNAETGRYVCQEWAVNPRRGDRYGVTATFKRVYDL